MNTHRWLVLLLVMLLGGAAGLQAQTNDPVFGKRPSRPIVQFDGFQKQFTETGRVSHRPINEDLAGELSPEELLEKRLLTLKEQNNLKEQNHLNGLAKQMIKDPKFHELIANLKDKEIQGLLNKIKSDQGGVDKDALKKLFDQVREKRRNNFLKPEDEELLKRWGKEFESKGGPARSGDGGDKPAPDMPPLPRRQSGPTPNRDGNSDPSWERLQEKAPDWLKKKVEGAVKSSGWVDSFMDKNWSETLRDLAKRAAEGQGGAAGFTDRARGLARYLPKVSNYLPKSVFSRTPELPSLPRLNSLPSMPSASGMAGLPKAGPGRVLLLVIACAALALVFWRAGGWWQTIRAAHARAWKLGPWPVRPGEVATRGDLVRAFEHLALLCLGQAARTCHHLDLADRIGEQATFDQHRRRESARTLARLYEQARYTPDEESLPAETMASARRELCFLAGVVAT